MVALKIAPRGTVTIPKEMRQRFSLKKDDLLIAEATNSGILLRPAAVYPIEIYSEERIAEFEKHNNAELKKVFPKRRKKTHKNKRS